LKASKTHADATQSLESRMPVAARTEPHASACAVLRLSNAPADVGEPRGLKPAAQL